MPRGRPSSRRRPNVQSGTQDPWEFVDDRSLQRAGSSSCKRTRSGGPLPPPRHAARQTLHLDVRVDARAQRPAGALRLRCRRDARRRVPFPSPFSATNVVETFSSDGPRRYFFNADCTAITPGNFSATGGEVQNKPDLTAADGVSTAAPGLQPVLRHLGRRPARRGHRGARQVRRAFRVAAQLRTYLLTGRHRHHGGRNRPRQRRRDPRRLLRPSRRRA